MPDGFNNARAYYDPTFPNSGDGFQIQSLKNAMQGLGFLDFIPFQPRAHNPPDTGIMVRGTDASSYYHPLYANDANDRVSFASGDSPTMSAPVSNPRIDIVYLTPSGDIRVVTGTEAASPTLPSLAPSGDTRLPICAVYHKVGQARVVNFESKDSNTGDGYIYQDLRPFVRFPRSQYPLPREVQLADGATITINAAAGEKFYVTIAGNRTIGIPQNPAAGREFILAIKASGADRTPTFTTGDDGFRFGSDISFPVSAVISGATNYYGVTRHQTDRRWDVIGLARGY